VSFVRRSFSSSVGSAAAAICAPPRASLSVGHARGATQTHGDAGPDGLTRFDQFYPRGACSPPSSAAPRLPSAGRRPGPCAAPRPPHRRLQADPTLLQPPRLLPGRAVRRLRARPQRRRTQWRSCAGRTRAARRSRSPPGSKSPLADTPQHSRPLPRPPRPPRPRPLRHPRPLRPPRPLLPPRPLPPSAPHRPCSRPRCAPEQRGEARASQTCPISTG